MVDVDSFWGILQLQHFQLGDAQSLYERGVFDVSFSCRLVAILIAQSIGA